MVPFPRAGLRRALQPPRRTMPLVGTTSSSLVTRNAVARRGMASSGSHQKDSDTPWIIAAGIGSAIGLYFVYGRVASKGHDTHHTGKQARNEESVAPVPAPPSDDVAESLNKEAKADVPIVAKAAEEPTSSEGPKDDTEDVNVPKTAEVHEEEEASFVKVDAEEVKEVVESVQQELKVDNTKIAKKAEESQ